jgi:hypothetical protein
MIARKLTLSLLTVFTLSVATVSVALSSPALVTRIRKTVARFDQQAAKLKKERVALNELSAEGGEALVWRGKTFVKADLTLYGETGRNEVLVYWDVDAPLFAFSQRVRYPVPLGVERPKGAKDKIDSVRLYYDKGEVRHCFVESKEVSLKDEACQDPAKLVGQLQGWLISGD